MRSIIEPTLGVLVSSLLLPDIDDTDGLRRMVRLDCTSATLVGVMGRALRAAAAAAEDKDGFDWRRINADAAAVAAFESAESRVRGYER